MLSLRRRAVDEGGEGLECAVWVGHRVAEIGVVGVGRASGGRVVVGVGVEVGVRVVV